MDGSYVDGPESGTMAGSHILIECLNSISPRHFPIFLVHVVCAGTRIVTNPDTEVLNLQWALLVDLERKMKDLS